MDNFNEYLEQLDKELPDRCTDKDLIKSKIYNTPSSICKARANGLSPPFIRFPTGRILYLKKDVIEWVKKCYQSNQCKSALH